MSVEVIFTFYNEGTIFREKFYIRMKKYFFFAEKISPFLPTSKKFHAIYANRNNIIQRQNNVNYLKLNACFVHQCQNTEFFQDERKYEIVPKPTQPFSYFSEFHISFYVAFMLKVPENNFGWANTEKCEVKKIITLSFGFRKSKTKKKLDEKK